MPRNEPVTPDGVTTEDLFALYERLADAIREVDTNHLLFIEGNYFATTFLAPEDLTPFDDNMVYTFHKYWNGTALHSIQYLLDIRSQTNVPLWLGETGENSNTWFYLVTRLMETHGIGVNWWTHKRNRNDHQSAFGPVCAGLRSGPELLAGFRASPHRRGGTHCPFRDGRGPRFGFV